MSQEPPRPVFVSDQGIEFFDGDRVKASKRSLIVDEMNRTLVIGSGKRPIYQRNVCTGTIRRPIGLRPACLVTTAHPRGVPLTEFDHLERLSRNDKGQSSESPRYMLGAFA